MSDEAKRLVEELRAAAYYTRGVSADRQQRAADLIERQATALAEVEALHVQLKTYGYDNGFCAACDDSKWPCATAAAIERAREVKR